MKSLPAITIAVVSALALVPACADTGGDGDEELDTLDGSDEPLDLGKDDSGPRKLPQFAALWASYPHGEADEVKELIGGAVDADWIKNTCTIRISRALNASGYVIPNVVGLRTLRGADKKRYAFRVAEFRRYLRAALGTPSISRTIDPATGVVDRTAFEGKQGIIMFEVHGWSDATGHLDLWDGSQPAHGEYFDQAALVQMWLAPTEPS